jgi:predicted nucleic acid-binding protein
MLLVDSSVWFAAMVDRDRHNARAKAILASEMRRFVTEHIVIETWLLLYRRHSRNAADHFWRGIRRGAAAVEAVTSADLDHAWQIGVDFPDQDFSIVDRTSFAVMERLGISRAASFDHHFSVYRFGKEREQSFEIVG